MRKGCTWIAAALLCALAAGCSSKAPQQTQAKVYAVGEQAPVGRLVYTVLETQWLDLLGQPPDNRTPKQRFLLVKVAVANKGSELLSVPEMRLEDGRGGDYGELTEGAGVPEWLGSLRQLKPGQEFQGSVIFDVPLGAYRLRVMNDADPEHEIVGQIDLPLQLAPKTTDTGSPAQ